MVLPKKPLPTEQLLLQLLILIAWRRILHRLLLLHPSFEDPLIRDVIKPRMKRRRLALC
jgi:hypothetical protein